MRSTNVSEPLPTVTLAGWLVAGGVVVGAVAGGAEPPCAKGCSVSAMAAARSSPSFAASASPMWLLSGKPSPSIVSDCAAQEIAALKAGSASRAAMPSPIAPKLPP